VVVARGCLTHRLGPLALDRSASAGENLFLLYLVERAQLRDRVLEANPARPTPCRQAGSERSEIIAVSARRGEIAVLVQPPFFGRHRLRE